MEEGKAADEMRPLDLIGGSPLPSLKKELDVGQEQEWDAQNREELGRRGCDEALPALDVEQSGSGDSDRPPNAVDQKSESSSSFACMSSEFESEDETVHGHQTAEGVLEVRGAGGASVLTPAKDEQDGELPARRGLNVDWKTARRGIEWRCQWLMLRLNELQLRSCRYDRILSCMNLDKVEGKPSAPRVAPSERRIQRHRTFRRKNRAKMETSIELEDYLARHPVFSRYGCDSESKLKKKIDNDFAVAEDMRQEESDFEERPSGAQGSVSGGQDSMERLLWKVEALQARVEGLRTLLIRGGGEQKVSPHSSSLPSEAFGGSQRPLSSPTGPTTSATFSPSPTGPLSNMDSSGRLASVHDSDDMATPAVEPKLSEIVKPADLPTPQWRLVDETSAVREFESSSEGGTDDETFEKRQSEMELRASPPNELQPGSSKRPRDGDSLEAADRGKGRGLWSTEFVPRKKRTKGQRSDFSGSKDL